MQDWIHKLQQSKNFIAIVGLLLVAWLAYSTTKVIFKNYELAQQIGQLEDEIALLQLQNENLKFEIQFYKTDAYLELQARDKLNKVESGEKLLILPRDRYENLALADDVTDTDDSPPAISNFKEWMKFLSGDSS